MTPRPGAIATALRGDAECSQAAKRTAWRRNAIAMPPRLRPRAGVRLHPRLRHRRRRDSLHALPDRRRLITFGRVPLVVPLQPVRRHLAEQELVVDDPPR